MTPCLDYGAYRILEKVKKLLTGQGWVGSDEEVSRVRLVVDEDYRGSFSADERENCS